MDTKKQKEVVIIQSRCPRFRVPFFNQLRGYLRERNVNLRLLYGIAHENSGVNPVFYEDLPWGEPFELRYLPVKRPSGTYRVAGYGEHVSHVTWHPVLRDVLGADLVVVEAATRYPLNYLLLLLRKLGGPKLAFWGHGWNHYAHNPNSSSERIKTWVCKRGDWYFAYTSEVRNGLIERGYDPTRVTDVQNAVEGPDGSEIGEWVKAAMRKELGFDGSARVALYCGRMYASKRLDFLIEAARKVKERDPSFVLVMAGAGPDQVIAEQAAVEHDFIRYVGPIFGERKTALFSISRVVVMPGMVGLGVVDAFHYGVPPIATTYPYHSPEIAYLRDGDNGLLADDSVDAFANAVWKVTTDDRLHAHLVSGCQRAAAEITVEEMARRFAHGILSALEPATSSADFRASPGSC